MKSIAQRYKQEYIRINFIYVMNYAQYYICIYVMILLLIYKNDLFVHLLLHLCNDLL